jgi:hypothetical protein
LRVADSRSQQEGEGGSDRKNSGKPNSKLHGASHDFVEDFVMQRQLAPSSLCGDLPGSCQKAAESKINGCSAD